MNDIGPPAGLQVNPSEREARLGQWREVPNNW